MIFNSIEFAIFLVIVFFSMVCYLQESQSTEFITFIASFFLWLVGLEILILLISLSVANYFMESG